MSLARIDLRSDTVTLPTAPMRAAMAAAEVGDDVYREDPTTRALEDRVAALLGKDAAVFVPSGTMANQMALLVHTTPGSEVIVGAGAHLVNFEGGAGAAWAGAQFVVAGQRGLFTAADAAALIRPASEMYPETRLICVENTHNSSGGRVFPQGDVVAIGEVARQAGLGFHLDGARLWNTAVATGVSERELAAPFDTVSVCFSKGLGSPAGSVLAGRASLIQRARRFRKMLGGAMRQSGVLAAASLYALDHHRTRLREDHESARALARALEQSPRVRSRASDVETNMVLLELSEPCAASVLRVAEASGVLAHAMSPSTIRLVTHLDVSRADAEAAAVRLLRAIDNS